MTATDNDNNVDVLARSGIFRDLPGEVLAEIAKAVRPQMVPPQTLIFGEGDPGDSLYIICSGRVRVFRSDESGLEIDLAVQGPGEAFGEISLLSGEPRSACVQVLEETHLLVLSKDDFDRILRKFPATSRVFFREMRRRLLRDEERLEGEVRESYKASRVSWFDFVVVLGVSVLLAMIFNSSNPNGIPILPAPPSSTIPVISAAAAMKDVQLGNALILDAMPENFYQKRHIQGSVNMPLALFDIVYAMTFSDENKERKIIVYGSTMSRPYDLELADKLLLRGFDQVSILEGGVDAWEAQGYPVTEQVKK
jgi:rhodanese-related sulfurtransferase